MKFVDGAKMNAISLLYNKQGRIEFHYILYILWARDIPH
jgi:hypothetical protein